MNRAFKGTAIRRPQCATRTTMKQTDSMAIVTAEDPQDCRSITDSMVPDPSKGAENRHPEFKMCFRRVARAHSHNLFDNLQIRC